MAIPLILIFGYTALVLWAVHRMIGRIETKLGLETQRLVRDYERFSATRDGILRERQTLERQAEEIYTLYEMTKELTENLHERDALEVFKRKLAQNVAFEECILLHPLSGEVKALKEDKTVFLFTLKGKLRMGGYLAVKGLRDKDRETFMILANQFSLVLQRIRLYQELEKMATTDGLTGLYTRRAILEHLKNELKRATDRGIKTSVLMIDIDYFKKFNDNYGHMTGDRILHQIAGVIAGGIREIDVVGRYGGEEFLAVLPETDAKGAELVARRLREAVGKSEIRLQDHSLHITVSIGVATFPDHSASLPELLDQADQALYAAKESGRNRVCVWSGPARRPLTDS